MEQEDDEIPLRWMKYYLIQKDDEIPLRWMMYHLTYLKLLVQIRTQMTLVASTIPR